MKLSINQATTRPYRLDHTVQAIADAGIEYVGLWVEPVDEFGVDATRRLLADSGVKANSMSRVGFLADKSGPELVKSLDRVKRALETCATLLIPTLSFVAGGLPDDDRSLARAEDRVRDALEHVQAESRDSGVQLMLEPIHPLFVTDRSIVTSVGQALRILDGLPAAQYGVLVDSWATFWDPELEHAIGRAGAQGRLAGYQINDFELPLPLPNNMNGRLLPGEGSIDLESMTSWIRSAGYVGPVEVEVFNEEVWSRSLDVILRDTISAFDSVMSRTDSSVPAFD